MYSRFFGFKERPFKLVPNPEYLFLSKSHEEALAHLHYAVNNGDGFVEITGEVGTGKTTLCRMFLENLDEDTEAAYIFNPKLDAIQLLKAINDEFGIKGRQETTKDLIDALNHFLIEKKSLKKNIILLIDEAQNLKPEVLEQLRLLSNLETTKSKLIQIFLVGQPELADLLDSYELRQLSQRITLISHLNPLTFQETRQYIQHRISIASHKPGVEFTKGASKYIYNYSNGIPRMINIACDRALLTAFGQNQKRINRRIVKQTLKELAPGKNRVPRSTRLSSVVMVTAACTTAVVMTVVLILLFAVDRTVKPGTVETVFYKIKNQSDNKTKPAPDTTAQKVELLNPVIVELPEENSDKETPPPEEEPPPIEKLQKFFETKQLTNIYPVSKRALETALKAMTFKNSRSAAISATLNLWDPGITIPEELDRVEDNTEFIRLAAERAGLQVHTIDGDLELLQHLNLPVILELYPPESLFPKFMALTGLEETLFILSTGEEEIKTTAETINLFWRGTVHIPWKNFYNYNKLIHISSSPETILRLKTHLREIGFHDLEITPFFDASTSAAIEIIQWRNGLNMDGYVGPLTQIAMYNENKTLIIPHLTK